MVKNLSNPLNARKVAQIIAEDSEKSGYGVQERDISVFLSDHRISDLKTALKQLKQENILPSEYYVSDNCRSLLIEEDFITSDDQITKEAKSSSESGLSLLGDINFNSIEFKTQIDSLKNKLIKSWSGGSSIDGHELDNFDRKFSRPMKYFKEHMGAKDIQVSDLKAFAVVYATDQLALGDNSKDDVYYLMFGRFDDFREELESEFGFKYSWPSISGTSFIEMGKKFSISPELDEFAKKFRGISGLDTYPDEVIQVFFFQLIAGSLIDEMVDKKLLFRWSDEITDISDPLRWLLPPPDFNMDRNLKETLTQGVITHTLLNRILSKPPTLLEVLREIKDLGHGPRSAYLAKKIEAALTRKSVALQFGTTLANFFENFRTNPAKVNPFMDTTLRYFNKSETIQSMLATIEHNVRTALKNSSGILKQYLRNVSDEQLITSIRDNLKISLLHSIEQTLPEFDGIVEEKTIDYKELDFILRSLNAGAIKTFFETFFEQLFGYTNEYAKSLEPDKIEPKSSEGGMTELTNDFLSAINYHGSKNYQTKTMINNMVENGLASNLAELICYSSNYITYQVAAKEGTNGEKMMMSLVKNYERKAHDLGNQPLSDGSLLKENPKLIEFLTSDLRQAHALVALASKIKTDAYNAWTPLSGGIQKHSHFINELLMPNVLYWQRQPREFIMGLVKSGKLSKSEIRSMVEKTHRISLVEAYCLIAIGAESTINSIEEAERYLLEIFDSGRDNFELNPQTGEAEISHELIYLWLKLQGVSL